MRSSSKPCFAALALMLGLGLVPVSSALGAENAPAAASEGAGHFINVIDQDLRSLVLEYAREQGLTPQIKGDLRQRIVNTRLPMDLEGFTLALQRQYGVTAYVDTGRFIVAAQGEIVTRMIPLASVDYRALDQQLTQAAIPLDRNGVKILRDTNAIMVTAPAVIVAQVAAIAEGMRRNDTASRVRFMSYGKTRYEPPR